MQGFHLVVPAILCRLHNTHLQPSYMALDIGPIDAVPRHAGKCTRPCCSVPLLSPRKEGSINSLMNRDHEEVCTLSRGVRFQPLSAPLQGSIRFLLVPVPAPPSADFAACFPPSHRNTGLKTIKGAIQGFHVPLAQVCRVRCLLWTGRRMGHESAFQRRCSHLRYRFGSSVRATSACYR